MDQTTIIIIGAVLIVLIVAGLLFSQRRRSERLRADFGPEYDRAVSETGDKRKAEAELHEREKRVEKLDLRPLDPAERQKFDAEWASVQSRFVDDPDQSVHDADTLLQEVMSARGYPVKDFEQAAADISVDHPTVVQHYRTAHDIVVRHHRGDGDTEDLRKAMINYRALFDELVAEGEDADQTSESRSAKEDARPRERV